MQNKTQNSTYLNRLRGNFLSNYKTAFWTFAFATIIVGPVFEYASNLLSFAFAFSSINSITYLPSTFANGGFYGAVAACFSLGTRHNPTKTAFTMFLATTLLVIAALLYMDTHGMIVPIQYRATAGDDILAIVFATITGYCVPLVVRKLNFVPA